MHLLWSTIFLGYEQIVELLQSTTTCLSQSTPSPKRKLTIATHTHTPIKMVSTGAAAHPKFVEEKLGIKQFLNDQKLVPQEPMHRVETAGRG